MVDKKYEKKRLDVLKKIIAFMTLGIDVSPLFTEMCLVSYTNSLIQKKMIYLYLTKYAEQMPDLCVMAINTFLKDIDNKSEKIRGLALRNLCSLRFSGAFEYLQPSIMKCLNDFDPYVRKTAIMGCIKLFQMSKEAILCKSQIGFFLLIILKNLISSIFFIS